MNLADSKAALARAYRSETPIVHVGRLGHDDLYTRGAVLLVVPGLWSRMHPELLAALVIRRTANLTGTCPSCGTVAHLGGGPGAVADDSGSGARSQQFAHAGDCPATDDHLREALRRFGGLGEGHRLYDPDPGSMRVEGRELWAIDEVGRRVGVVVVGRRRPDRRRRPRGRAA